MDLHRFYVGEEFHAYQWLGAHLAPEGALFRVYAPNAQGVGLIGDFNGWTESAMTPIEDGNFYQCAVPDAREGQRYKFRIHERGGRCLDRADPYGFASQPRPETASILHELGRYQFHDEEWMASRSAGESRPVNIYELHLGSWRDGPDGERATYSGIAQPLLDYIVDMGYNYVEFMPLCEYPCDASWGYQATGFYCPTARYGQGDELKHLIDQCHQRGVGVILDISLVHFAVDDFGLAQFDGTPLYEYPHPDVGYNEWGSKNFQHGRGDVRSFLQSAVMYWLEEYHFDGIRMDAVRNMLYWQGNEARGVNQNAAAFLKTMNEGIKRRCPGVMLIAEDSSACPNVTKPVWAGGLGFDYKWDLGWMNDTLNYFRENTPDRLRDYHKLTFSMHYFYNERYMMPFSHDEAVHGKATILQKMNGQYEGKFPQARALYLYMYAHPGKKLNFMGGEFGQLREWDESREQDWNLLTYPIHDGFRAYMRQLNRLYLTMPALYERDYDREGFQWLDCQEGDCAYAFLRRGGGQTVLAAFNFSDEKYQEYTLRVDGFTAAELLLSSDWQPFGGAAPQEEMTIEVKNGSLKLALARFSAHLYLLNP